MTVMLKAALAYLILGSIGGGWAWLVDGNWDIALIIFGVAVAGSLAFIAMYFRTRSQIVSE